MARKADSVFVVKVQVSQSSSDGLTHLLIYNRSKEYKLQLGPVSKQAIKLLGLDPELPKAFYIAQLSDDTDAKKSASKTIKLLEQVKDEDW